MTTSQNSNTTLLPPSLQLIRIEFEFGGNRYTYLAPSSSFIQPNDYALVYARGDYKLVRVVGAPPNPEEHRDLLTHVNMRAILKHYPKDQLSQWRDSAAKAERVFADHITEKKDL